MVGGLTSLKEVFAADKSAAYKCSPLDTVLMMSTLALLYI